MATGKGRKKGRNRERDRSAGGGSAIPTAQQPPAVQSVRTTQPANLPPRMPSPMARITGALLSIMTAGGAIYMIVVGLADESATAGAARIVGGLLMAVIAVVVGVLSVAPEFVLRLFGRRLP